jgi:DNA-binding NarL/FixJ family response regulator
MIDVWIMTSTSSRRARLSACLGADPSIKVAGATTTLPSLRSMLQESPADVALIDRHAERSESNVRDWLSELIDVVPIVVLNPEPDGNLSNQILNAGVGGILGSDAPAEQIVHAVKSVAAGLIVLDGTILLQRSTDSMTLESLTPRETEVLHLLADGLGNKEIAGRLHVSEHTIKFHIGSILAKLGASSRTEAVSRGLRSGLIEL